MVGIDADARCLAYAVLRGGAVRGVSTLPRSNAAGVIHGRYDAGLTALMRKAADAGAVIYLEDIYLAARDNVGSITGFKALAEVQGEILREARRSSVPVVRVNANTWHSKVLGFTRGRDRLKGAAMKIARARAGRDLTQHEADAVCVGLHGAWNEEPWLKAE